MERRDPRALRAWEEGFCYPSGAGPAYFFVAAGYHRKSCRRGDDRSRADATAAGMTRAAWNQSIADCRTYRRASRALPASTHSIRIRSFASDAALVLCPVLLSACAASTFIWYEQFTPLVVGYALSAATAVSCMLSFRSSAASNSPRRVCCAGKAALKAATCCFKAPWKHREGLSVFRQPGRLIAWIHGSASCFHPADRISQIRAAGLLMVCQTVAGFWGEGKPDVEVRSRLDLLKIAMLPTTKKDNTGVPLCDPPKPCRRRCSSQSIPTLPTIKAREKLIEARSQARTGRTAERATFSPNIATSCAPH